MNRCIDKFYLQVVRSFQIAAQEYIFPKLRLVSMMRKNPSFGLYFYVDGEIFDDDFESINLIHTYFGLDLPDLQLEDVSVDIIKAPSPQFISKYLGECLYARRESVPLTQNKEEKLEGGALDKKLRLYLAMQRAMVNHIFPQIRTINLASDGRSACFRVITDGEISKQDYTTLEHMRECFLKQIPLDEIQDVDLKVIRIDFPQKITTNFGELVYYRKEYESCHPLRPYDVYGSLSFDKGGRGAFMSTAEKFLSHKSGGAYIVSFQNAAIEHIFPKLRLVSMRRDNCFFELYFYVEGELSEDDKAALDHIRDRFGEDLYHRVVKKCSVRIIRADPPTPIFDYQGECLFARKETPVIGHVERIPLPSDIDFYHKVRIAMQRAMINRIFPHIRAIQIAIEEKSCVIRVTVCNEISLEERDILEEMKVCFTEQIPDGEMKNCAMEVVCKDVSEGLIGSFGETMYLRAEGKAHIVPIQPIE